VRLQQQQLEEQERMQQQEIIELNRQLAQATLTEADREHLETAKRELAANGPELLRAEQQRLTARQTQLQEQLRRAEQRWQELSEQSKKLAAADRK
jgi:hypothetical protein